jgi:hypothetical protein
MGIAQILNEKILDTQNLLHKRAEFIHKSLQGMVLQAPLQPTQNEELEAKPFNLSYNLLA